VLTSTNGQLFGMDNLNIRYNSGSFQFSPISGSFGAMAEMIYMATGVAISHSTFAPQTANAGTWYTLQGSLNAVGNQSTGIIQDYSNNLAYRVTCIVRTLSPNYNAFLIIERLA